MEAPHWRVAEHQCALTLRRFSCSDPPYLQITSARFAFVALEACARTCNILLANGWVTVASKGFF